jgi:hypothetical protein
MRRILCVTPLLLFAAVGPGRADDQAEVRKVIDRAIKAQGGADKLAKFKAVTLKMKGKFYGMSADGVDYTGEFASQEPDKSRMEITVDVMGTEFKFVRVLNGNKGWTQMMGQTTALDKDAVTEAKEEIYAGRVNRLVGLLGKDFKLEPVGEVKVGDRPAIGVKVSHKGHRDINLFFDKKTNLLLKAERPAKDPMSGQEFTQTTLYAGYKETDGIKTAHKVTVLRDGKKYVTGEATEIKAQEKLDDSTFAKP